MVLLPGKRLIRRGAPEEVNLFLTIHKRRNQFGAVILKGLPGRLKHGQRVGLFSKMH